MVLGMTTCSDLLWPLKSSNTGRSGPLAAPLPRHSAAVPSECWLSPQMKLHPFPYVRALVTALPKEFPAFNKRVPSSSLSFDKDIEWQVMRGVHSLFAELMPMPPGPAHLSWPGKKLPFHFRFPGLGKGSSHRRRS